jgi:hypothetical protein
MHTETVWNCCHLPICIYWFFCLDNWTKFFLGWGDTNTISTLIWQKWKMLNWVQCQFRTWKSWVIWSSKIQLFEPFNYLIWFDTKMLNWNWSLVQIIEYVFFSIGYLNQFCKNELNWKQSIWHKNSIVETLSSLYAILSMSPCQWILQCCR